MNVSTSIPIIVAIIAGFFGIILGTLNTFFFDLYKRYKDGITLAASFYGELSAYEANMEAAGMNFDAMIGIVNKGNKLNLRYFEKEKDYVFEKSVEKLGLLGPGISQQIVRIYSTIRGYRIGFEILAKEMGDMKDDELRGRLIYMKKMHLQIKDQFTILVPSLKVHSSYSFAQYLLR